MSEPKITIGMTCYNAADTIAAAIDSAVAQAWDNKELLIVDDASQDNSIAVIQDKIKDLPYAHLIAHPVNQGAAAARNTLIESATGEFLAFFDDDDRSAPSRLRVQYQTITAYERESGLPFVICQAATAKDYANGYVAKFPAIGTRGAVPQGQAMVAYNLYLPRPALVFYGSGTPACSMMARLAAFKAAGPYDLSLRRHEDADMAVRLGLLGAAFVGTPEILLTQTLSGGADKHPEISYESEKLFLQKYADILRQHRRYAFALTWARIKYLHYSGHDGQALLAFLRGLLKNPVMHLAHLVRAAPSRMAHERKMQSL